MTVEPAPGHTRSLTLSLGSEWGHALAMAVDLTADSAGEAVELNLEPNSQIWLDGMQQQDLPALAGRLAPGLLPDGEPHARWLEVVSLELVDGARAIGHAEDQATYEERFDRWQAALWKVDSHLETHRYLLGNTLTFADLLLFAVAVRLDTVYFILHKANAGLLEDFPALHGFSADLYERPEVYAHTDFQNLVQLAWSNWQDPKSNEIIPIGTGPQLNEPHFRQLVEKTHTTDLNRGTEEAQDASRVRGEWVRPQSQHRSRVGTDEHPVESGRYHLFAPYNCPWSHRALLGRSVLGLEDAVGASVVYFRRDPDHGWQFNPDIPGCTADLVNGFDYVEEYYEAEGSDERSVPILYDTREEQIVNNESAEILRMFATDFRPLASRDLDLYPEEHRERIDLFNEEIYQRINNGAYKAGFANSHAAYRRAFERYFAALSWVNRILTKRPWLLPTDNPTEADLRLFPTIFRHDAVYFARFRLNQARVGDYPGLANWLDRIMEWPGVASASNLDHARNGYFGRSGNEIVPAGPSPLSLSPAGISRNVWLNQDSG